MANIKSAKKRVKTSEKARLRNKSKKTAMRTQMRKLEEIIANGTKEEALVQYNVVSSKLDRAVGKGLVQKNYSARQKSNFMKKINVM
ncbi:30S ribosomal protein S20 [Mollicutes bacterium LVI A0078]|nr:30S ribosomal protein S20 [Mollicutes bacterium LVI A0075]WOO91351.1 30S ribosomal protein S20 [Mollicutes bacterium LVI A0078]